MNRNMPAANKICAIKERFANEMIMQDHLQNIKPSINTKAPNKYGFLQNKAKKEYLRQSRQNQIDRENRHLITKITHIMSHPSRNNKYLLITLTEVSQSQQSILTNSMRRTESEQAKKSLNSNYRKQELIKIVMENQKLLKRIQEKKPAYNRKLWEEDRKQRERQIANISEYPYKQMNPHKTLVQYWRQPQKLSESAMTSSRKELPKKLEPISENTRYKKQQIQMNKNQNDDQFEHVEVLELEEEEIGSRENKYRTEIQNDQRVNRSKTEQMNVQDQQELEQYRVQNIFARKNEESQNQEVEIQTQKNDEQQELEQVEIAEQEQDGNKDKEEEDKDQANIDQDNVGQDNVQNQEEGQDQQLIENEIENKDNEIEDQENQQLC